MSRKVLIAFILIITSLNCLLTYGLLWNPYSLYFERPEFSSVNYETQEKYSTVAVVLNLVFLVGSTFILIFQFVRKRKFFLPAPAVSILTLTVIIQLGNYYPDSIHEYTKNGYRYREEVWYLDGKNEYKRWKSADLDNPDDAYKKIIWILDSASVE